ncbi:hypothetical protein BDR26DRAFT_918852 [Obelidium mucronatum]|nr:hypothetical protein BDR26DRAFT_918852 [Obelidium mucronatum]
MATLGTNHTLLVFNQNYSSWSLRPLFFVRKHKLAGAGVAVRAFNLSDGASAAAAKALTPTGCLPALQLALADGGAVLVADSLAIIETLADAAVLGVRAWPADPVQRALARAAAAEMHAGFGAVRAAMPCNLRARFAAPPPWSDATTADIRSLCALWQRLRANQVALVKSGNAIDDGWLFGEFTAVDAMYFPIVTRFLTYSVHIDPVEFPLAKEYFDRVLRDETVKEMYTIAENEEWVIQKYDDVYPGRTTAKLQ